MNLATGRTTRAQNTARGRAGLRPAVLLSALAMTGSAGCIGEIRSDRKGIVPWAVKNTQPPHQPTERDPAGKAADEGELAVNGDKIKADELWRGLHAELSLKARTLTPAGYRAYVEQAAARLITDKIAEMLLYQRASLRLSQDATGKIDTYVDGEIRRIVASEYGGIQRRYEKYLASEGRTLDNMREKLRREIIISSYLEREIRPKVPEPTRAEVLAAFEASADSFSRPPRRRMSLIDVRVISQLPSGLDSPTREQYDAARAYARSRIQTAQAELKSGAGFAEIARRYSEGLHAAEGGAWGWMTRGSVRERFEPAVQALFRLDAGEVSDIIETRDGFFLVCCDEIDPGLEPDFQTVQPKLVESLFARKYNRLITELVARLRAEAGISRADLEQFHAAVVQAALDLASSDGS